MKRTITSIMVLFLLLLTTGALRAQVDKGVTSIGNEVDCTTINPSVDQTVNQYGEVVTKPSLTRNGMLITADCCPTLLQGNLTDTVTCVSISMAAVITDGTVTTAVLQVFSDANRTNQVGNDIATTVTDETVKGKATGLTCYTRYYFRLKLNNQCNYDWADSTRDATLDQPTFCTVANPRTNNASTTDKSHERLIEGTNTIDSVYDMQNNAYAVVQIGDQCWMKQNLRCTISPKGILGRGGTNATLTNPRYYDYNENQVVTNLKDRGLLYNWPGILDTTFSEAYTGSKSFSNRRGICPKGWHLPTDAEWKQLEKGYLTEDNGTTITDNHLNQVGEWRGNGSGKLAGGCDWTTSDNTSAPGNYSYAEHNISGFSAFPVGYRNTNGIFTTSSTRACFWSSSACGNSDAYARYISSSNKGIDRYNSNMDDGFSVRCLRNPEYAVFANVNSVTCTTMKVSAQVVGMGTLTGKTVAAYTNAACTTGQVNASSVTTSHDSIYATLTGLNCYTTYYIKVTATNSSRTVQVVVSDSTRDISVEAPTYCTVATVRTMGTGTDKSHEHFVEGSTSQIDSVYDHENNAYAVVQIGNQCWLKENMRAITSPSGTSLLHNPADGTSMNDRIAYYFNNSLDSAAKYGVLYNWPAAMDSTFTNETQPVGVDFHNHRGICPQGWHLPTDDEWKILEKGYLTEDDGTTAISDAALNNAGFRGKSAGRLAGGCDWVGNGASTTPNSYLYAERNASGLNVVPAGRYHIDNNNTSNTYFEGASIYADFWTATPHSTTKELALGRHLVNDKEGINLGHYRKGIAFSVRCVRDIECDFVPATSCSVLSARQLDGTADRSHEHQIEGTNQIDSVYDHEDNAYGVVQIGQQCWLKSNMRASTRPNGTPIYATSGEAVTTPRCFSNPNSTIPLAQGGYLYNWPAAVDSAFAGSTNVSFTGRRGICPKGWHLPDDNEWQTLLNTVGTSVSSGKYSGKLATGCSWEKLSSITNTNNTAPGNFDYVDRNSTGFSALPMGRIVPSTTSTLFSSLNEKAEFWSANTSSTSSGAASQYSIAYNTAYLSKSSPLKNQGLSVRCLRDIPMVNVTSDKDGLTLKLCNGSQDVSFSASVTESVPVSYHWSVKGVDSSSVSNTLSCHFTASGTYNVRCVAYLTENDSLVAEKSVTIATGTATPASLSYCVDGNTVTIKAATTGSVQWDDETVQNPAKDISHTFAEPGFHTISYTDANGCTTNYDIAIDTVRNLCNVNAPLAGTDLGNGKFANKEWTNSEGKLYAVSDHEGNVYRVVQMGNYCWLAENMRATTSPKTGTYFVDYPQSPRNITNKSGKCATWYGGDSTTSVQKKYGLLYNWNATMDTAYDEVNYELKYTPSSDPVVNYDFGLYRRGICPLGWHVSNINEWTDLQDSVGENNMGKIAGGCDWTSFTTKTACMGDYAYGDRNVTSFDLRPAGYCSGSGYQSGGTQTYLWYMNPSELSQSSAPRLVFIYTRNFIEYTSQSKGVFASVRCVRDYPVLDLTSDKDGLTLKLCNGSQDVSFSASVTESVPVSYKWSVNNVDSSAVTNTLPCHFTTTGTYNVRCVAYLNGNDSLVGSQTITIATGTGTTPTLPYCVEGSSVSLKMTDNLTGYVYWDDGTQTQNPTKDETHNYAAAGVYTITLMNANGCSISRDVAIDTVRNLCSVASPNAGTPLEGGKFANKEWTNSEGKLYAVSDHEGNMYRVVEVGEGANALCWLQQNMRCSTSPKNHLTSGDARTNSFIAYYYDFNNSQIPFAERGYLYNWAGALDTTGSANISESFVCRRGICPAGWHIPTDGEWWQLEQATLSELNPSDSSSDGAYRGKGVGRLTGGCDWEGTNATTTPNSYSYTERNISGFNVLPTGYGNGSSFYADGNYAYFWTANVSSAGNAFCRIFYNTNEGVRRYGNGAGSAFSVRCVRDYNN